MTQVSRPECAFTGIAVWQSGGESSRPGQGPPEVSGDRRQEQRQKDVYRFPGVKLVGKYNPDTGQIVLLPSASLHVRFHEEAHREQHQNQTAIWRVWNYGRWFWPTQWLVTLLIEWDAYRRTRRNMIRLDLWNAAAETEAREILWNYFTCKTFDDGRLYLTRLNQKTSRKSWTR